MGAANAWRGRRRPHDPIELLLGEHAEELRRGVDGGADRPGLEEIHETGLRLRLAKGLAAAVAAEFLAARDFPLQGSDVLGVVHRHPVCPRIQPVTAEEPARRPALALHWLR